VIARAAVSPEAVLSLGLAGSPTDVFARSIALCQALEAHGILVFANDPERKELVQAIKRLEADHPEVQGLWSKLAMKLNRAGRFMHLRPPCTYGLDAVTAIAELILGWSGSTDVAVVADSKADTLGLGTGEMVRHNAASGIDIVRAPAAAFAGALGICRADAEGTLPKDTSREELWARCFLPLARTSVGLTLLDRYLLLNLANRAANGTAQTGFVAWFLDHLDNEARDGAELEIIAYRGRPGQQPPDGAAAAQLIANVFDGSGGRLKSIKITVTEPGSYLPHDRHLSSNLGVAVTFPASFDVFDDPTVRKQEGVEYAYRSQPEAVAKLQTAEQRYRDNRTAETAEVYAR
jgi:hypothetical protein